MGTSVKEGKVQTVLGPVDPATIGHTLPHEHLLIDATGSRPSPATTASDLAKWLEPLTLENHFEQRRHPHLYRENFRLLSIDEAIEESILFRVAGGDCIVDATSVGLARDPEGLQHVSRVSGVHVVMGAGYYVHEYHPPEVALESEEQLRDRIVRDVTEGVGEEPIRAGIIGEIGLTWPVHPDERKVLHAAAKAQVESGAALAVHLGRNSLAALDAVKMVEEADGRLDRTIISHLDRTVFEPALLTEIARTGCYLEFDLFGIEESYYPQAPIDMPNDATRVDHVLRLFEQGFGPQMLISHDIDAKVRSRKYGGEGRDHIIRRITPLLRRKGMSEEEVRLLLVTNPVKMLTIQGGAG